MTIDEMLERKRELGYSYAQIAQLSGVPLGTVQRVLGKQTKNPRFETLRRLEALLKEKAASRFTVDAPQPLSGFQLQEEAIAYKASKPAMSFRMLEMDDREDHTVDDYYALPKGTRVELIDGRFYEMASPTVIHNTILMEFVVQTMNYVKAHDGSCKPFFGPIDVQLDRDDKTMVVPDAIIVCNRDLVNEKRIFGAPEFILEVASPSNFRNDYVRKLRKYQKAGVKEYWIADPRTESVTVYRLEESPFPEGIYSFSEKIPVGLYNGDLEIDFSGVWEYLRGPEGK